MGNISQKLHYFRRLLYVLGVLCTVIALRVFVLEVCMVPSDSMMPTIQPGDLIVYEKLTYGANLPRRWSEIPLVNVFTWIRPWREADALRDWGVHRAPGFRCPQAGDVVVVHAPEEYETLIVKRLMCILPKDTPLRVAGKDSANVLKMAERDGRVVVNRLGKIYVGGDCSGTYRPRQNFYVLRGDNVSTSYDSRYFGYVPETAVVGRMGLVLFSWDDKAKGLKKVRWDRILKIIR